MFIQNGYTALRVYDNSKPIFIYEHIINALIKNSLHDVFNKDNVVHHENLCKLDNTPDNLEVMSRSKHKMLHKPSLETRQKMSEAKTGNKHPKFNSCIPIRENKDKRYKQGFIWIATPNTKDRQIRLSNVDLEKCIQKVQDFIKSERNTLGYTDFEVIRGE